MPGESFMGNWKIHTVACMWPSRCAQLYRFKKAPGYPGIHGLIFQTNISLEISFSCSKQACFCFLWFERETAEQRPLEVCWRIDFAMDRRLRPLASEALQRHFSIAFQNQDIIGKIFFCSKRACFAFVNRTRNGWTASARSLPTHRFHDWLKTEAALKFNPLTGYPQYERHALHSRHWLGESMKRSAEVENVFFIFICYVVKARKISSFACVVPKTTHSISTRSSLTTPLTTIKLIFLKERWTWKSSNHFPTQVKCQKIST